MDTFIWPFHKFSTEYQTNSVGVPLGGGYVFTPKPTAPAVRLITLKFPAMAYLVYKDGFDRAIYIAENPDIASISNVPDYAWFHFSTIGFLEGRAAVVKGTRLTSKDYPFCVGCLEMFYLKHQLWSPFIYKHPAWGDMTVKFSKPLVVPENNGPMTPVVSSFEIVLQEQA